jgi:hypothetical protein
MIYYNLKDHQEKVDFYAAIKGQEKIKDSFPGKNPSV